MSDQEITKLRWALKTKENIIDRLKEAIRRLADQDATLSVQGGDVIVTMDATLADEEREAVEFAVEHLQNSGWGTATLRNLLERMT